MRCEEINPAAYDEQEKSDSNEEDGLFVAETEEAAETVAAE
jgi:hypothetical protein